MINMEIEVKALIISIFLGGGIGLFHFGGLWWTVKRMNQVRHSAYEFILSFFLRTGMSIGLFYLVSGGRWEKLLAALVGFLTVRYIMIRKMGIIPNPSSCRTENKIHEY